MNLSLTDAEAELLRELLDSALKDMSYEISDTDLPSYKAELRTRRETMRAVREKLDGAAPA